MSLSPTRPTGYGLLTRTGVLVGLCTVALTAAFLGVVALAEGRVDSLATHLPAYVLAAAVVFAAAVVTADHRRHDGRTVLRRAAVAGGLGFGLLTLGAEGALYALTAPGKAVASRRFVYLVSAAVVAAGLCYWGLRHRDAVARLLARTGP